MASSDNASMASMASMVASELTNPTGAALFQLTVPDENDPTFSAQCLAMAEKADGEMSDNDPENVGQGVGIVQ
jgi:hypothetical protein